MYMLKNQLKVSNRRHGIVKGIKQLSIGRKLLISHCNMPYQAGTQELEYE
jgi:hypothetical protein